MNLRTRVMIAGGVVGALLGVLAASLYLRSSSGAEGVESVEKLPAVPPTSVIAIILAVLTVLRQIAGLGQHADAGK